MKLIRYYMQKATGLSEKAAASFVSNVISKRRHVRWDFGDFHVIKHVGFNQHFKAGKS